MFKWVVCRTTADTNTEPGSPAKRAGSGGRGSLWGPLFGAFLIVGFQEYFRGLGLWRLVLYGVLLIVVMLFARRGLSGLRKYVW